jgi:inner membrane protein
MMFDAMWVWGGVGLLLIAIEIATSTFYALWFGIAAFILALLTWALPNTPMAIQLGLFAILSFSAVMIWKFNFKHNDKTSRIGQSRGDEIGRVGTIIAPCGATQNGTIQFTQGVMGSREWIAFSDEYLNVGDYARVVSVEGNALRVTKTQDLKQHAD